VRKQVAREFPHEQSSLGSFCGIERTGGTQPGRLENSKDRELIQVTSEIV